MLYIQYPCWHENVRSCSSTNNCLVRFTNTSFGTGFNVETVEYKNISFTVWDVGGQDKVFIPPVSSCVTSDIVLGYW